MPTSAVDAGFSNVSRPNPLIHIKAADN